MRARIRNLLLFTNKVKKIGSMGYKCRVARDVVFIGKENIHLGNNVYISKKSRIEAHDNHLGKKYTPVIVFKDGIKVNEAFYVSAISRVELGKDVLIGSDVFITDNSHGRCTYDELKIPPNDRILFSKGPVIIGDRCWIGHGVTILPGVTLGENVIVGAGSIVTKSFPANCIIGGNPARLIKELKGESYE